MFIREAGMEQMERVPVYIRTEKGRTVCLCHAGQKRCGNKSCERDTVTRDKFRDWYKTMKRDIYGK